MVKKKSTYKKKSAVKKNTNKKRNSRKLTKLVNGVKNDELISNENFDIILNGKKLRLVEALDKVYPVYNTFNEDEITLFLNVIITYLRDFNDEELSYTDLDDIFSLGSNKIIEFRLYKESEGGTKIITQLERIKKQNKLLKESLVTRRKDRLKDASKTGITILDIAAQYDEERLAKKAKEEFEQISEGKKVLSKSGFEGNMKDIDSGL
jgi:hypothetical protein